jgi:glycosyltransferase involved in cell wall biosynthesis
MNETLLLLLDSAPLTWTSQEDRHLLLCRELSERGVQPIIVLSGPIKAEFLRKFSEIDALVFEISYEKGAINFYRQLKQIVRAHHVTVAHIIFFDYFSPVAWIVRAIGVRRIIYEMQNSGIFRATSWRRLLLRARTKMMTAPVTRVIAISEFVKDQLVKAGVAEQKIVVRYLGIDNQRFRPSHAAKAELIDKYNVRADELVLSTVSYLRPFKNPQVLVEGCKELKERNVPARLFVAGDGEMLTSLKELSRNLGVDEHIHWLGNVADPKPLLQASDLFLLASTGEAFGLVLTEAMACGVPVVGTRSGSLPEVIAEGKTGLLVPPHDAKGLASAIESLSKDVRLRRAMAENCVARVKEHFTVERAVADTLAIYDTIKIDCQKIGAPEL